MQEPRPRARRLEMNPTELEGETLFVVRDPLELRPDPLALPALVVFLMQFMDGTRTPAEICTRFALETGRTLDPAQVERLVADLDQALLLEGPRFEAALEEMLAAFRDAPVRAPALAGRAYPAEPAALREHLDDLLGTPPSSGGAPPLGLVAPHIDLERGRDGYRAAYGRLAGAEPGRLFVLLGTSHAGAARMLVPTAKDFATPLGLARTDKGFLEELALGADPFQEEFLHRGEHSLEFQVLLLQALRPEVETRIVPLLTGPLPVGPGGTPAGNPELEALVASLKAALAAREGRVTLVAGADLAHVGPRFGDPQPLEERDLEALDAADRKSLALAAAGDAEGFFRDVAEQGDPRRICGLAPIYLLLRALEPCTGQLLHYGQAAAPDASQCVSFAALSLMGG